VLIWNLIWSGEIPNTLTKAGAYCSIQHRTTGIVRYQPHFY